MPTSYAPNPFTASPDGMKQVATASALRNYAPNAFAGSTPQQMAPHLAQAPPLDPDIMAAYQDPTVQQAGYGRDINRLWRQSPNNPMFQPGYQHSPLINYMARDIAGTRNEAQQLAEQQKRWRDERVYGGGAE